MSRNVVMAPFQSLEQYRSRLSGLIDRPVYICAGATDDTERDYYRENKNTPYRKFGAIELFLSNLSWKKTDGYMNDKGKVVNGAAANGLKSRACTLAPSQSLYLAYPVIPEDQIDETTMPGTMGMYAQAEKVKFHLVDLCIGNLRKMPVRNDSLPSELVKYVRSIPMDYEPKKKISGVMFAISCGIEIPNHIKHDWTLGPEMKISYHKDPAWLIHSPGQYVQFPHAHLDRHVKQGITVREPGSCVVCRGSSGEKVHIGFTNWSDGPYLDGLLCRPCFKSAAASWMKLLDQVE